MTRKLDRSLSIQAFQDFIRSAGKQIFSQYTSQVFRILGLTGDFTMNNLGSIDHADQAPQQDHPVGQFGIAGNGHLTATLQAMIQGPFRPHPNGGIAIIQRRQ